MKLIFYLPNFNIGGAEKNIINLANEAIKQNIDVKILVNKDIGLLKNNVNKKIKITSLNQNNKILCILKLVIFLRKQERSVLISILECSAISIFAKLFTKNKIHFISRVCNTISAFLNSKKNFLNYSYHFILNFLILKFSDKIIVQNNYMKNDLINIYKFKNLSNIHILNNCLDVDTIFNKSKEKYNFKFDNSNKSKVFVTICTLRKQKNLFEMLEIFNLIIKSYKDCYLVIVGDGELNIHLKKIIKKFNLTSNIFITGYESNPYKILSKSNYYISTSNFEGTSNSILESLLLGIPVISVNCPSGILEILNKNNGVIVEKNNLVSNSYKMIIKIINKEIVFKDKIIISEPIINNYNINIVFNNFLKIVNV